MKQLFIIDLIERNKPIQYNDIMNGLIRGHELSEHNLLLRIDKKLTEDPEINEMCRMKFDHVITVESLEQGYEETNKIKEKYQYTDLKEVGIITENENDKRIFRDLRETIGQKLGSHFMFKERGIQYGDYGDSNEFIDNKIVQVEPHRMKNRIYQPQSVFQMFDHIHEFDYLKPIKLLKEYYEPTTFYQKLYEKINNSLNQMHANRSLSQCDDISPEEKDTVMLQYLKCRPNIKTMILWKPWIHRLGEVIKYLEQDHNVYYIKTLQLNRNGLQNLIQGIYGNESLVTINQRIDEKMKQIDPTSESNPLSFIIYESKEPNVNKIITDMNQFDVNQFDISESFCQAIEQSELLLNQNSIDMLKKIKNMNQWNQKIQNLRKIMYSEMSLLEMDRLLITNYKAIPKSSDFDECMRIEYKFLPNVNRSGSGSRSRLRSRSRSREQEFSKHINKALIDGHINCLKNKRTKNETMENKILDPSNFFYFQGIKVFIN